jgi:hypothetical protein
MSSQKLEAAELVSSHLHLRSKHGAKILMFKLLIFPPCQPAAYHLQYFSSSLHINKVPGPCENEAQMHNLLEAEAFTTPIIQPQC